VDQETAASSRVCSIKKVVQCQKLFNSFINGYLFHFRYNYSFTHEGSSGTKLKMKIVSGSSHCGCCYDNGTIKRFSVGLEVGY
jgi:hypothetical protein